MVMTSNKRAIRRKLIGVRNEIELDTAEPPTDEAGDDAEAVAAASAYVQRDSGVSEVIEIRSHQITQALIRLEQGKYGVCADCGAKIPSRRLEALPYATLCVSCQSVAERLHRV